MMLSINLDVGAFTAVQFMSFEDDLTFGIDKDLRKHTT